MRISASYPTTDVAGDSAVVGRFVTAIEALGFDRMMACDPVVKCSHERRDPPLNGPYTEKDSFHDPFVPFGLAAASSERLEFATGALVLPQRPIALTAQQATNIDLLSNARPTQRGAGAAAPSIVGRARRQSCRAVRPDRPCRHHPPPPALAAGYPCG